MGDLKARIAARKQQVSIVGQELLDEYENKTKDSQRIVSQSLKFINDQMSELRRRLAGLMFKLDDEHTERSRLEGTKAQEVEAKYGELQRLTTDLAAKNAASCSYLRTSLQTWQDRLTSVVRAFQDVFQRLSAAAPEHYLREAEKHQEELQSKAQLQGHLDLLQQEIYRHAMEREGLRTAATLQMESLYHRSAKALEDKRRTVEQRIEARKMQLVANLEKTAARLNIQ